MATSIRRPAVAGRFYPADSESLRDEASFCLFPAPRHADPRLPKASIPHSAAGPRVRAVGCLVPHAGYMYSGHVAGAVFGRIEVPELCVVLCPNHTGVGQALAVMSEGEWETPLGNVPIDSALAENLKTNFPALVEDSAAHRAEHAIEVELPFLLLCQPKLKFVPIALGTSRLELLEQLGAAVAATIAGGTQQILIVASSDMNHYESDALTRVKDHRAIEKILTLDARGLYDVVTQQSISMCGFGPAVTMLTAAKKLGAKSAELVKYATSGDVSGDHDMVVGYAGVIVA